MRIGILTSVHPPLDTRIYFKQAGSLARAGHTVYLVARRGGDPSAVNYIPVPAPGSRRARVLTCLRVMRAALRLRCDAYHIHDPELLPIGVILRHLTGAKLIYDVHENVRVQIRNKYWIPRRLRGPVARLYGAIERVCLRWVDQVILAEDSYSECYRGYNVTLIRNYPILAPESRALERRSYSGRPLLAYCGVVARIRGGIEMLETLALLIQELPEAELRIIGPCFPESFANQMQQRIAELGLQNHVRLFGRLPLDRALAEVAQCDIGLALLHPDPNYVASLPTKMFEYMSLRLPVVVSNFPLWRTIVESSRCGVVVDPQDPASVAAAIAELARDPETLRALGTNGRRSVVETYSWDAEERRLLDLYDSLDSEPGALREPTSQDQYEAGTVYESTTCEALGETSRR